MKYEGYTYTPGPWSYGGKFTRAIFANDGVEVCKLHTRPLPFPSDEAEWLANARLIAAAPELLEALKLIEKAFAEGDLKFTKKRQSDSDPYHPANIRMCSAIAKAEGRE